MPLGVPKVVRVPRSRCAAESTGARVAFGGAGDSTRRSSHSCRGIPDQRGKLTSRYTTNEETGERVKKEVPMPVRRWWWKDVSGNVVLNVRYGNRRVELKPGKTAIEVGETEQLVPALTMLADAVKAGELDEVLLAMKSKRRAPQRKSR